MNNKEIETYCPKSRLDWRNWLEKHHQSKQSIWLVFYKRSAKIPTLSWSEAVDEALCFGWIDSTKKTLDDERYIQYFSRRKPKSNWSKINKEKVDKLIQNNLMKEAGFESIKIAKKNGYWTILDEVEALIIPQDLQVELSKHDDSLAFFNNLSNSAKKILLYWVISAKKTETRQKRIHEIAENAKMRLKPKQFR